jgi:hypothetical protein
MLKKSVEVALKRDKFVISSATRAVISLSTRVPERIVGKQEAIPNRDSGKLMARKDLLTGALRQIANKN